MNKVLVLFAHPVYQTSLLNKSLIEALPDSAHVTLHDLYECYPNFMIDVEHEQALLDRHDVVIFQHPLYWYSSPAILKEWMDLVLAHGYAYGTEATALQGKYFMSSITSGGDMANYEGERNIRTLLTPFEYTAKLCKMKFLPPFVTYGGLKIKAGNFDQKLSNDYLFEQTKRFKDLVDNLIQGQVKATECEPYATMNDRLAAMERRDD